MQVDVPIAVAEILRPILERQEKGGGIHE
jgi:hypothetical protein